MKYICVVRESEVVCACGEKDKLRGGVGMCSEIARGGVCICNVVRER